MADAGHDVWVIDPWQLHTDAIRSNGLRVEDANGDRSVTGIRVANTIGETGSAELLLSPQKHPRLATLLKPCYPFYRQIVWC